MNLLFGLWWVSSVFELFFLFINGVWNIVEFVKEIKSVKYKGRLK